MKRKAIKLNRNSPQALGITFRRRCSQVPSIAIKKLNSENKNN